MDPGTIRKLLLELAACTSLSEPLKNQLGGHSLYSVLTGLSGAEATAFQNTVRRIIALLLFLGYFKMDFLAFLKYCIF